jgi:hypothetical protein
VTHGQGRPAWLVQPEIVGEPIADPIGGT